MWIAAVPNILAIDSINHNENIVIFFRTGKKFLNDVDDHKSLIYKQI